MKRNPRPIFRRLALSAAVAAATTAALAGTMAWFVPTPVALAQAATPASTPATTPVARTPGTYKVQSGDSWISVAARTGVSVAELQAANPRSMRENEWLIVGETLVVPGETAPAATSGTVTATTGAQTYVVQAGESWNSIAAKFNTTRRLLQAANPLSIRYGEVLLRGEKLIIPPPGATEADIEKSASTPTSTAAATATEAPTLEPTPEATPVPTEVPTEVATTAPTAVPTEAPTETPTEAPTVEATAAATETAAESATDTAAITTTETTTAAVPAEGEAGAPACPTIFAAYPDLLAKLINGPTGGIEGVLGFVRQCNALDEDNVKTADWTGDGADDLAVVITNPQSDAATPETDLLIFDSNGERYDLAYRARAAGAVRILAAEDINEDGKPDIVWVDTTCGASTCFDTVNVRSWDGTTWADWTDKTITMAYADVTLNDSRDTSQGQEIQLIGGVYGSVGAGPQRSRTELWGSVDGAPYRLVEKVYDRSNCLYHKVLDANEALQRYQEIGLVQAKEMYTEAVTNRNLTKCWEHDNELDELRSFSLFRLALISAYDGKPDEAAENVVQLQQGFPDSIFTQLGQAWLAAYQPAQDIAAACMAATQFATENPVSYESLSDYGYSNPTFRPEDLCPILNVDVPTSTTEAAGGSTGDSIATTAEATATVEAGAAVEATATVTAEETVEPVGVLTATVPTATSSNQEGELPPCPTSLDAYAAIMPDVIKVSEADPLIVETWLRLCDGMADDRGGMLMADVNGDGIDDAVFLPTIVSDLGFGPDGTQGAVLIYHGQPDGSYKLAYNPEIFGQPTMIGTGDFNGDGRPDVAWTVEGCSTFCVKEVQVLSWNPKTETYDSIIEPGATIAEGSATFEDLPPGAPGKGQQLALNGGVSGTADGGLAVPHVEAWQAVGGRNFRRLSWTYDRDTTGNNCLGLRLIEADAALQAADILGYTPAAGLYEGTLDPSLRACSIYGIPGDQELLQLRGLGYFRLVQTQAFSGTLDAAKQTLATMTEEQPETTFTKAATGWLAEFERSGSGAAACAAVQTLFDRDTVTWQITDHFGYNHPALAAEQVCFIPPQELKQ